MVDEVMCESGSHVDIKSPPLDSAAGLTLFLCFPSICPIVCRIHSGSLPIIVAAFDFRREYVKFL